MKVDNNTRRKVWKYARTVKYEGIGTITFIEPVRWIPVDASDFAEGYGDIVEVFWNDFVCDLREGRYLSVKRLQKALEERYEKSKGHKAKVVALRLSILADVLLNYEVYGYAPHGMNWDSKKKRKGWGSITSVV